MIRKMLLAGAVLLVAAGPALADPIEGRWKTASGNTAEIVPCGGAFCITLKTGEHAGKQIGRFEATGEGTYAGTVTDPNNDKTYKGNGRLKGNTFTMKGCVLGIICRDQTWSRL